jgi:hypothetical protein
VTRGEEQRVRRESQLGYHHGGRVEWMYLWPRLPTGPQLCGGGRGMEAMREQMCVEAYECILLTLRYR